MAVLSSMYYRASLIGAEECVGQGLIQGKARTKATTTNYSEPHIVAGILNEGHWGTAHQMIAFVTQ